MNIDHLTAPVVDFVRANQGWAPLVVAALAFGESLAVISAFVPATVMLVGIGALIGAADLAFWPIWIGAVIGATLGDWVSYDVARYFGPTIQHSWPLKKQPQLVARAEDLIRRYGVWGVFIGRFFGPLRAIVPLAAGVFEMPRTLFQVGNIGSALVWATLLLGPGAGLMEWLR